VAASPSVFLSEGKKATFRQEVEFWTRQQGRRNESPQHRLNPGSCWRFVVRRSNRTPSIVPRGDDQDVYLVVDDLGRLGRVWRESDFEETDLKTVVTDLLEGQYKGPLGIFAFNTAHGWRAMCQPI
jgi:hypothetical protein